MGELRFEWDAAKAEANVRKHGVDFVEAVTVFADPVAAIHDDPDHSEEEERELIIGNSDAGKLLIVSFTESVSSVRIISARKATRSERRDHEESRKA